MEQALKLSPSTLNLYLECPRCFWLQFNGLRRPDSMFPSLPGGMDRVLKIYFDEYRGTDDLPPIVSKKLPGILMNPLPKTLLYTDKELRAIMVGKLDDALDFKDGTFAPLDHKTRGSAPPEEILWPYQLQMDSYDFLMQQNGMPTVGTAYLVYYYPTPGQLHENFPFEVMVKEVKTDPQRAKQIFEEAVALLRGGVMPEAAKTCSFCAWAEKKSALKGDRPTLLVETKVKKTTTNESFDF